MRASREANPTAIVLKARPRGRWAIQLLLNALVLLRDTRVVPSVRNGIPLRVLYSREAVVSAVSSVAPGSSAGAWTAAAGQYSFLITKYEPRIVPASFAFCRANLKRDASSAGMSIPSESLKPTARFSGPSRVYITFTDRPLS